ncbi:MAG: C39 family peptidase [Acetatifactor sp.]|nr:C39 family peptidase [Acetatifactor sp.]
MHENLSQVMGRVEVLEDDLGIVPTSEHVDGETAANSKGQTGIAAQSYADQVGLDQVDKPKERTYREIISRLKELGQESSLIQQVVDNAKNYPEQLLEALANNPELQDFAAHYLENKGTVTGEGLTEGEKSQEFPLFLQWDPRWGYASYGDNSVVGLSGCGPTALSMVLWYLTGNEELTPDKIADYSMKNGYYISGTGTKWLLLEEVPPLYGIWVSQPEADDSIMKEALDGGDIIILSMAPGDFTVGGHFIVIYGYTEEGFLVNDPNCVARSRRTWTWEELKDQTKHMWVFSKHRPVAGVL